MTNNSKLDAMDVADLLSNHLNQTDVDGLGHVFAGVMLDDQTILLEVFNLEDEDETEGVNFLLKVTKMRKVKCDVAK